ncbi:IS3 family transposase [Hymenobacter sp. BT594]|uniref:IS3 family transposase n=1 Tax=Hymenobacter guriensis TaxID=2793065 RepID=A0ABS0L5T6_9BACT|nr:IS3 family transposase [Hymenobacter guriensis]
MSRYRFIDQHRDQVPVRVLCTVLQVAPSSYYAGRQRRQQPAAAWERAVVRAFQRHGRRYGTRRLRAEVHAEGHRVGRWRIRRTLAAHGLRAQRPRCFVPRTTDSGHGRRVAPNRLLGQPRPTAPNQVWVGDITCLPKQGGGWLYLASWQDACHARSSAGTCVNRCPKTWSARPWRCASPHPDSSCTPIKAANTRPRVSATCWPTTALRRV